MVTFYGGQLGHIGIQAQAEHVTGGRWGLGARLWYWGGVEGGDEVSEELIHTNQAADVTSEEAVKDLSEDKEGQGGERDCGDVLVFRGETPGRVRCATGRW